MADATEKELWREEKRIKKKEVREAKRVPVVKQAMEKEGKGQTVKTTRDRVKDWTPTGGMSLIPKRLAGLKVGDGELMEVEAEHFKE
ncbi:hypothetical protein BGZ72_001527 [Mortierella alpina]|nr:hypothetical protein BGZ72_001527 [Mortierella alpina]